MSEAAARAPLEAGELFIERSRHYLAADYQPRLRHCLEALAEEDLWWRPNDASNSVGNLVLHLCGNIRQWVVSGIGGEPDVRSRQTEFDARAGSGRSELRELLEVTLRDVDRTLAALEPDRLLERGVIQGNDVTMFEALYHAVEHFSMHAGQVIYITKLRMEADLGFYEVDAEAGTARPRW